MQIPVRAYGTEQQPIEKDRNTKIVDMLIDGEYCRHHDISALHYHIGDDQP